MVSCSFTNCEVTARNNPEKCTFHRIPTDPVCREKWLRIINREKWIPNKSSSVCSKHFNESCFLQRTNRRLLKSESIPTICIPVKLMKQRLPSSYTYRDIAPSKPPEVTPGPSTERKLLRKCALLKRKNTNKNKSLKGLKEKNKRLKNKIISLEAVVKELDNRPGLKDHRNDVHLACNNNLLQSLINRVNDEVAGKIAHTAEYEDNIRKFALTVHFYSPRSYVYIRDQFGLCLPHPNTLTKAYSPLECEPLSKHFF